MSKITIKDIAKKAGVANSTVTNALNPNSKKISDSKRQEILEIVEEFGYKPMKSAQSLSNKNKKVVGCFLRTSDSFADGLIDQKLVYYINKYAHEQNIDLVTIFLSNDEEIGFNEIKTALYQYQITHIILQGVDVDGYIINNLSKLQQTKILFEIPIANNDTFYVSTDNFDAQYKMVTEIINENNIQNVLHITGGKKAYVSIERKNGFISAVKKENVIYDIVEGSYDKNEISNIITNIDFTKYDYIACPSDTVAGVVANHCNKLNIKDIIISGFDGATFLEYLPYKVYTVHQKIGNLTLEILKMIKDDNYRIILTDYTIKKYL